MIVCVKKMYVILKCDNCGILTCVISFKTSSPPSFNDCGVAIFRGNILSRCFFNSKNSRHEKCCSQE